MKNIATVLMLGCTWFHPTYFCYCCRTFHNCYKRSEINREI